MGPVGPLFKGSVYYTSNAPKMQEQKCKKASNLIRTSAAAYILSRFYSVILFAGFIQSFHKFSLNF